MGNHIAEVRFNDDGQVDMLKILHTNYLRYQIVSLDDEPVNLDQIPDLLKSKVAEWNENSSDQ